MIFALRTSRPLLATFAAAVAAGFVAPTPARAEGWTFEAQGAAEADSVLYRDSYGEPTRQFFEQIRLEGNFLYKYGRQWKIKLAPKAMIDPLNPSTNERYWIDLPEGYLQMQENPLTLQAGFNTFNWGVTDGYNPLDVVSARRYYDPTRSEKLGAPSITAKLNLGAINLEGIYIPKQRESLLPGVNSRWLPREVLASRSFQVEGQSGDLLLPPSLAYSYTDERVLDSALDNNFGFRMQANGLLSGLDLSAVYFQGEAPTPGIAYSATLQAVTVYPTLVLGLNPDIALTPIYYRQQTWGGSLVYANFGMIFRAEAAWTRTISKGAPLPDDAEEYVGGVERSFSFGDQSVTALAQMSYAHHIEVAENSSVSLSRLFDRALIVGLRYPASEALVLTASGVFDTIYQGRLARFEGSYALNDTFKLLASADGLWGAPDTPIGTYRGNKRLTAGVRASF